MIEYLFDHLGLLVWVFLLFLASFDLADKRLKVFPRFILFCIACLGIFLDSILVVRYYVNIGGGFWFDFLGVPVFLFISWLGYSDLHNSLLKKQKIVRFILLFVGLLGLSADVFVLIYYFFF